jgi:hypothetical protein
MFLAAICATASARAQDSYDAPIAGIALSEGPRWGAGAPPATTLGSVGGFAGWRWTSWRLGLLGRADWWNASEGPVFDAGLFASGDATGIFVDPQLSVAPVVRVEPATFRLNSHAGVWAWAPSVVVGLRVVGVEMGAAATYEYWLGDLPGTSHKDGFVAELRLGLELVEIGRFVAELQRSSTPQTP